MFPRDWSGEEAWLSPSQDAADQLAERESVTDALNAKRREKLALFDLASTAPEAQERLTQIETEIATLRERLWYLPQSDSTIKGDQAACDRRTRVVRELEEAFEREELSITLGGAFNVQWSAWRCKDDFAINYGLSTVTIPRGESTRRIAPAFVAKAEAEAWLGRFVIGDDAPDLTPKAQCSRWLAAEVARNPASRPTKQDYLIKAKRLFPGLTDRQFNSVWEHVAPPAWKKPGPKA